MMLSPDGSAALSPDDPFYRKPPYNIEVEQALLGAVLLQNAALERAGDLAPAHFFDPLHSDIYDSIQQTVAAGRLASPVTLKTVFEDRPAINGLNAAQYLGNLAAAATSIANVPDYAKTIRALALRRALIIIGEDLVASSYDGAVTTEPGCYQCFYRGLVAALRDGAALPVDPVESVETLQILELARDSASRGAAVTPTAPATRES